MVRGHAAKLITLYGHRKWLFVQQEILPIRAESETEMKSWKTTVAGIVAGLIPIMQTVSDNLTSGKPLDTAQILLGLAIMVLGVFAKDFNVKSSAPLVLFMVAGTTQGCSLLGVKSAYDQWRDLCGKSMMALPEMRVEAQARKVDLDDLAEAVCELSDVVAPFMRVSGPGSPARTIAPQLEALSVLRAKGIVR